VRTLHVGRCVADLQRALSFCTGPGYQVLGNVPETEFGTLTMLARGCAVDFAADICPGGAALRSAVAGVPAGVIRDDRNGVRSFLVHCDRPYGQHMFDSLLDSGTELGVGTDGLVSPGL